MEILDSEKEQESQQIGYKKKKKKKGSFYVKI